MNTDRDQDAVTLAIKKTHLHLGLGILIGFRFGYATAMAVSWRAAVPEELAAELPPFAELTIVGDVATDGRPGRGPESAQVTVVEFTDYECPFCGRFFRETYRDLVAEYDSTLRFVVRNFPIRALHPQAQKAAEAAECAHEQDMFWVYHDVLFERAPALDVESLKRYAAELGLDTERFDVCLDLSGSANIVEQDFEDGQRYGVDGTPTFFINGRMAVGVLTLDEFRTYIDAALREVSSTAGP